MSIFILILSLIFNIAAFVLGIFALFGSTYNKNPLNKVYAAQLSLADLDLSTVFPTVSSVLSSSELTLNNFGLPSYINIGLWSYCTESSNGTITYCSKPHGIQDFSFNQILKDNINNNDIVELIDSVTDIVLPSSFSKNINLYNRLAKAMFICLFIAVILFIIQIIINVLKLIFFWLPYQVKSVGLWVLRTFSFLSFLSVTISGVLSTAVYVVAKKELNKDASEYGLTLSLDAKFYGVLWGSVCASLFAFLILFVIGHSSYRNYYKNTSQAVFVPEQSPKQKY